jgi:hypothetical protein
MESIFLISGALEAFSAPGRDLAAASLWFRPPCRASGAGFSSFIFIFARIYSNGQDHPHERFPLRRLPEGLLPLLFFDD